MTKLKTKIKRRLEQIKIPLMYWAILYAVICIFCIFLYILMTIFDWWITGKGNEPELRAFITMLLSAGAVGGVVGIGKMFVDKDKNGTPDVFEKDDGRPSLFNLKGDYDDERRTGLGDSTRIDRDRNRR
ncbi:MAG: hypothetical protein ACLS9H_04135 [Dialister sp.]